MVVTPISAADTAILAAAKSAYDTAVQARIQAEQTAFAAFLTAAATVLAKGGVVLTQQAGLPMGNFSDDFKFIVKNS